MLSGLQLKRFLQDADMYMDEEYTDSLKKSGRGRGQGGG